MAGKYTVHESEREAKDLPGRKRKMIIRPDNMGSEKMCFGVTEQIWDWVHNANAILPGPFKRLGVPEDIVGAMLYLASEEANWVTGALLAIDGGFIL